MARTKSDIKRKKRFRKRCADLVRNRVKSSARNTKERVASEPSPAEKKIAEYLTKNNIRFVREHHTPYLYNHKTQHLLYFDFYLPDYNAVIEFDGWHHYKNPDPVKLRYQKYKDQRKNKYCVRHKMPLLRIPYWLSGEIENLICEFFDRHF